MASKMEVDPVTVPEVDELEDEFESEDEDSNPNGFRIHEPLQPPQATLFTTQVLHSMLSLCYATFYWDYMNTNFKV